MKVSLQDFSERINDILPIIIKEFTKRQLNELSKGRITLPQFLILDFLERNGEAKMSALARFMSVSTAAMTGTIDRLVKHGCVTRDSENSDRRIVKIRLMPKGSSIIKKINSQRRHMIIDVFGRVSERDRSDYLRILTNIKEVLSEKNYKVT
ncbi:MAG: MarR family transcriptional regulator [Candidatus Omnitrophota bacterium]|jgi:5'-methylthioadenosine phosphorylase